MLSYSSQYCHHSFRALELKLGPGWDWGHSMSRPGSSWTGRATVGTPAPSTSCPLSSLIKRIPCSLKSLKGSMVTSGIGNGGKQIFVIFPSIFTAEAAFSVFSLAAMVEVRVKELDTREESCRQTKKDNAEPLIQGWKSVWSSRKFVWLEPPIQAPPYASGTRICQDLCISDGNGSRGCGPSFHSPQTSHCSYDSYEETMGLKYSGQHKSSLNIVSSPCAGM